MKVSKIPAHEARFRTNGLDSNRKKFNLSPFEITIPGTTQQVSMVRIKPANEDETYFYDQKVTKDRIVVHFTAGYLKGDISALTKSNYHVSVPFVIARDGTIYNLFQSTQWSYHLGKGALGGNKVNSRKSIGIELSNIGPLVKQDGKLYSTYTDPNNEYFDVYCNENETEYYLEIEEPYRNYNCFATFTEDQYESLRNVLKYLTARYDISMNFIPETDRYNANQENAAFTGIVSHVNFRKSGKWDIGPAFDWERVMVE